MRKNKMKQNKFLLATLLLTLLLVSLAWTDQGKKNIKSETPQIQKPPVESPVVTNQSQEKPKAESPAAPLQNFYIPWSSINAGGELNLSSTNYKMKATTGESVIGQSQSTNYKMGIGFWYGVQDTTSGPVCTDKAGDANGSGGNPNLSDIIYLVNYIFKGGTVPNPICRGDANGSGGNPNLSDIIYLVNYVFKGGPAPVNSGVCCL